MSVCNTCALEKECMLKYDVSARMFCNRYIEKKPLTNEDRLNAMTTEEKAEFLATTQMNILLLVLKPFGIKPDIDKDMVVAEWLDWLKQEVEK